MDVLTLDQFGRLLIPQEIREQLELTSTTQFTLAVQPQWVLEVVSKTPGGEYDDKMIKYAQIGVLYYVIYDPDYWRRDKHEPFEVYRLVNGSYERQTGNPVWMPEMALAIGCEVGTHEGCTREWLYWYNQKGGRFPTPANVIEQEQQRAQQSEQRAEQERQRAERLAERLRQMGVNPDTLD
jgi:bifunctional DNA-binding transcriptional regulator/antitoxin component of YhaV-PrlF toxin-antitoxin module